MRWLGRLAIKTSTRFQNMMRLAAPTAPTSSDSSVAVSWSAVVPALKPQERRARGDIGGRGGTPNRRRRPAAIWRKGESIRPTAKNQTRGNLILHDQAESRRRRIAHWRPFQNVCWSHAPSGDTRTPAARAGSSDELGTRHASSPGTSQSPGAGEQRAGPRGV